MAAMTLNVSLSKQQASLINAEVESGNYMSASEVVREALRLWIERRIAADVAELERRHAGAWERDVTPREETAILEAKHNAREELFAEGKARPSAGGTGRRRRKKNRHHPNGPHKRVD
jgi:putative addiction module CopG family antidote